MNDVLFIHTKLIFVNFVTLFGMCRFTLINTISMKHLVCRKANKNSYTFGWEIPMAMFCFLAEARVEIDTLKP